MNYIKAYIKEHLQTILAITFMLVASGVLILSNEIRAQRLPTQHEEQQKLSETPRTQIEDPIITGVFNESYNTLVVEWAVVDGASGYQVYRSDTNDGEYILLEELSDGMTTSYSDTTCECGKVYYYYIKACQLIETELFYGEASTVVSGKATPEKVSLHGTIADNDTKVMLKWDRVDGAHGYEVYKDDYLVANIDNPGTLTWSEADISKDLEISYKVRAYYVYEDTMIYGNFSAEVQKDATYITVYSPIVSGDLSSVTQYKGVPYVPGGTTPRGWDCSGFTQWVMKNYFGINIPKPAAEQGKGGMTVSVIDRASWQPGDILCYTYGKNSKTVRHVALYLGDGKMIHALSERYDTLIQDVDFYETWDSKTRLYSVKRYY